MPAEKLKKLIEKLRVQYLPYGDAELFDRKNLSINNFFKISDNISQITIEKEAEVLLISKITPMLFLQVSSKKSSCNIGILKNVTNKISEAMRSNVMVSSN